MITGLVNKINNFQEVVQHTYDEKISTIKYVSNPEPILILEQQFIDYHFNNKLTINDLLSLDENEAPEDKPAYNIIHNIAGGFYKRNKYKSRIALDDFISACYLKAWRTITEYNYQSNQMLYQQLKRNLKHACIDVLRTEGLTKDRTNRNTLFHNATDLPLILQDSSNMENNTILSVMLQEVQNKLPEDELKVFQVFLYADNIESVTLSYICDKLGLKHKQQASRILNRLRTKFEKIGLIPA